MPFFTVIIPVYNRREMLKNAVDSVLAQSDSDFELIVVDDGSNDGTPALIDEYGTKIKYIYQENSGVSRARNSGITASGSPNITLLDSDDTWHKDKLSRHREFIKRNPGIQIHQTEDIWIRNGARVNPGLKHQKPQGRIFIQSLQLCMISPSSVCISKDIFDKYGMFDERMKACEDYDLWLRVTPFEETGLIKEKLITRYAGHDDQLSSAFSAMDRFRLYSILKLLGKSGDQIEVLYRDAAIDSALKKAGILLTGAEKRDNTILSTGLKKIISQLEAGSYMQTDYQNLLEI